MSCDQKATISVSKLLVSVSGTKVHSEQVTDCLHFQACFLELHKMADMFWTRCVALFTVGWSSSTTGAASDGRGERPDTSPLI